MSDPDRNPSSAYRRAEAAAAWVLRCDRGLTASEQDEFSAWLGLDPRHREEIARHRRHWNRLNALAAWVPEHSAQPNLDLLAPPLRRRVFQASLIFVPLAAAAGIVLAILFHTPPATVLDPPPPAITAALGVDTSHQRVLPDGSVIELNRGAAVVVDYSPTERRVVLRSGEAHFSVVKDATRPFFVRAHEVDVRAVGTAFNVRLDAQVVEVLVTEGQVQVSPPPARAAETSPLPATGSAGDELAATSIPKPEPDVAAEFPILSARQRAVISLAPAAPRPQIATLTPGEIERVLAWQHRMLDFTAAPLNEIVAEFNRRNAVQLVVVDPELASVRISAALRSDNIDGFVRLLELGFNVRAERRGGAEIVLRRAR